MFLGNGFATFNKMLYNAALSDFTFCRFPDKSGGEPYGMVYDSIYVELNGERAIMENETRDKLTEQQHQIDKLRTKVEARMETMEAKNESAIDRLQLSNEKSIGGLRTDMGELRTDMEKAVGGLRTDMERSINSSTTKIMVFTGIAITVVGVVVSIISLIVNLAVN